MTPKQVLKSNKRIFRYTLIVCACITGMLGAGFLLLLALERTYGDNLLVLVAEHPRVIYLIIGFIVFLALMVLIFIVFILKTPIEGLMDRKRRKRLGLTRHNKKPRRHVRYVNMAGETIDIDHGGTTSTTSSSSSSSSNNQSRLSPGFHRFPTLSEMDAEKEGFEAHEPTPGVTLRSLMQGFRAWAAGMRGLYYSEEDVSSFIASLASSKTMILQGMSGTGKTSLPVAFGMYLGSPTEVVPVQPTWKERADVLGYYNEFTGRYSESQLLKSLYAASKTDEARIVVLDEANIARVEYYFAEFLSLLELPEAASRRLPVAPSGMPGDPELMKGGSIALPTNVWFVMTANNDDSTFSFSDKVYDRASVIDLDRRAQPFAAAPSRGISLPAPALEALFEEAQARYALPERDARRVAELDAFLRQAMGVSFGNRVMLQLSRYAPVYAACGRSHVEALDQVLSRKVLRKLSAANPALVRARSGELLSLLGTLFGEGQMPLCEAAVRRISDNG